MYYGKTLSQIHCMKEFKRNNNTNITRKNGERRINNKKISCKFVISIHMCVSHKIYRTERKMVNRHGRHHWYESIRIDGKTQKYKNLYTKNQQIAKE